MGLLQQFRVAVVCSTDDPTDTLEPHSFLAQRSDPDTAVYPTWRPDKALLVEDLAAWTVWVGKLEKAAQTAVGDLGRAARGPREAPRGVPRGGLPRLGPRARATRRRAVGRRHGREALRPPARGPLARRRARRASSARRCSTASPCSTTPAAGCSSSTSAPCATTTRACARRIGPDTGFDSIADFEQARPLSRFLDRLDQSGRLAKTILYNLNPADNELMATMIGNFQDGVVPGKMQWGSAWWFLDQLDGMEAQIRVLANMGLLSRFVGMLTDSRSFLSYSRHDYFRRLLCDILGHEVRRGRLPDDRQALGGLVANVCFYNARDYFGFGLGKAAGEHATKPRPA